MASDHIRTARDGDVLTVTFDNPRRRNAIDTAALDRLDALAAEIAGSADVRAVVLTGAGEKAFTSGFDLTELRQSTPERLTGSRFSEVIERWARLPMPLIGALNGHCMGGGVHVAVACDALVSVPGVRFMIPAARFGFVYSPGSIRRIAAALGPARAAALLYLGEELVAEDLVAGGFIRRIVANDLTGAARALAAEAAQLAPLAVRAMKEIVREQPSPERVDELIRLCAHSEDVREGLAALNERRTPVFTGR